MNYITKPIYGIAYSASNSSIHYCDDWATDAYSNKWSSTNGAGELQKIKNLGFNQVRLYYFDPARSHVNFLKECQRVGLMVEYPISNNLISARNIGAITTLINEAKQFSCVKMYQVGNEMGPQDFDNIAWAIETIVNMDPSRAIINSSIFDAGFISAKGVYSRLSVNAKQHYIAGVNMYFYSNPAVSWGDCLQGSVKNWYNDQAINQCPLIISEIGWGGSNEQQGFDAVNNTIYGSGAAVTNFPKFMGVELFAWRNEAWKGTANNESLYGICNEDGTPRYQYQAVANFAQTGFYRSTLGKQ